MLRSYFKIGWRNLAKNRLFTTINVSGMAISITSFILISLFIYDELQYDKHIENRSLKFRVYNENFNDDGQVTKAAMVPPAVAPALAAEYPEIDSYFRFLNFNSPVLFEAGNKKLTEDKGGYADPSVFDMFSLKILEGNPDTALKEPNTVAISEAVRQKYFDSKSAVGENIEIFNQPFKVTAVFQDFPAHSHLQLNYFISLETFAKQNPDRMQRWGWNQFHTYVKLKPGTDFRQLESKLKGFAERNAWPKTKSQNGSYYIPHLMPVDEIYLEAYDQKWDIAIRGNVQTVYILAGTAFFILIIAILNFINLSTSRAMNRVKEVGVRKAVGAFRIQLIYQFISESVIIVLIALLIGAVLTELILPLLNSFTEKNISGTFFVKPVVIGIALVFSLLMGIAAGLYPAFYLSGHKPAIILSNRQSMTGKTVFRKGLVVFQFVLSFFLIIGSLIVSEQLTYMRTKDMGFDKDNLLVVKIRGDMRNNLEAAKHEFSNHPGIVSATMGYGLPGEAYAGDGIRDKKSKKEWPVSMLLVDQDYIKTLDLDLIAGRDFSKSSPSDERNAFIISESTAKMLGYPDPKEALQHELLWPRWDNPDSMKEGRVVGVVKDIHLNSLRENLSPVILQIFPDAYSSMTFRIKAEDIPSTVKHLETTWKKFNTEWPFEYKFIDDNFDQLYKSEEKLAMLFSYFTTFTIFVACLGLFGLVVYNTSQRYKEISIRKVLGAEDGGLIIMLSRNYFLLIAIAFILAVPISYYAANLWLQKFAFHIPVQAGLFIKAGLMITLLSVFTVGIQSFKAARTNPVKSLKSE